VSWFAASIARSSTAAAGIEAAIAAAAGQVQIQALVDLVGAPGSCGAAASADINLIATSKQHRNAIMNTSS
jgi:sulfite reductase beta subunit-like hemoprotein